MKIQTSDKPARPAGQGSVSGAYEQPHGPYKHPVKNTEAPTQHCDVCFGYTDPGTRGDSFGVSRTPGIPKAR